MWKSRHKENISPEKESRTYESVDQRGVLVVVGDVDAEEVDADRVFLPHAVKQHHHLDIIIYHDGNVGVLHDGDSDSETRRTRDKISLMFKQRGEAAWLKVWRCLPVLYDFRRGAPGEGVVVPAVGHGDAVSADGQADSIRLVVDGDGAKVGVEFVFFHLLRADQLTVHDQTCGTRGQRRVNQSKPEALCQGSGYIYRCSTCSAVRHQVENVTGFGVDVEADVRVASPQVDDEVRVVIHWVRNTQLVTHPELLAI